jgi:hypothetical protein
MDFDTIKMGRRQHVSFLLNRLLSGSMARKSRERFGSRDFRASAVLD